MAIFSLGVLSIIIAPPHRGESFPQTQKKCPFHRPLRESVRSVPINTLRFETYVKNYENIIGRPFCIHRIEHHFNNFCEDPPCFFAESDPRSSFLKV